MSMGRLSLFVTAVFLLTGCPHPYLEAGGQFGAVVSQGVTELQGATAFSDDVCLERARLAFDMDRVLRQRSGEAPVTWDAYLNSHALTAAKGPPQTWAAHCAELRAGGKVVDKALAALGGYAGALKQVAGADYSGKNLGGLVTDIDGIVGQLPIGEDTATSVLKKLPGPVGALTGILEKSYAEGQVKEIVVAADPPLRKVLESLSRYGQALQEETEDAKHQLQELLAGADHDTNAGLMQVLLYEDLAQRWRAEQAEREKRSQAFSAALDTLAQAQIALAKAGQEKDPAQSSTLAKVRTAIVEFAKEVKAATAAGQ